jgi:Transmembrane amino acid transporter protein
MIKIISKEVIDEGMDVTVHDDGTCSSTSVALDLKVEQIEYEKAITEPSPAKGDIESVFDEPIKPPNSNSFVTTIFLILNTMIGSGILNQPQVFRYSGILGGLIMYALASFYSWVGLVVLVEVGFTTGILNYSELAKKAFGFLGEWWLDFFIVLYSFGGLMSYITIVGGTSSELFQSWGCTANFCEVISTTSFFIVVFDLPLCLVRFYGHYG